MVGSYREVVYRSIEAVLVVIEVCERGCKSERELTPFSPYFHSVQFLDLTPTTHKYSHDVQECRYSSRLLGMRQQDDPRLFELSNYFLLLNRVSETRTSR